MSDIAAPATVAEWESDPLAAFQKNVAIAHATTLDAQADAKRIATGILAKVLGALAPLVAGAVNIAGAELGPAGVVLAPLIGDFIAGEAADYAKQHDADLAPLTTPAQDLLVGLVSMGTSVVQLELPHFLAAPVAGVAPTITEPPATPGAPDAPPAAPQGPPDASA